MIVIWLSGYLNGEVFKCRYFFSLCGYVREEKLFLYCIFVVGGRVVFVVLWFGILSDGIVVYN